MSDALRLSRPGDEPALKHIWKTVFGDTDEYIDTYFTKLYVPGSAVVYELDGTIVSASHMIDLGYFVSETGKKTPCSVVYAFATLPEYRSRGIGTEVVKLAAELTSKNGVGVICPAERSLFGYYEKLGYKEYFYVQKSGSLDPGIAVYGSVRRVGTAKYIDLRRALLSGRSYIDFSEKTLSYQKHLCDSTGGGLYSVITDGVQCCAACEIYDGKLYIKELLAPDGSAYNSALLLCRATGCRSFSYRTTAHPMAECSPFGMVLSDKLALRNDTGLAWLGFAFD